MGSEEDPRTVRMGREEDPRNVLFFSSISLVGLLSGFLFLSAFWVVAALLAIDNCRLMEDLGFSFFHLLRFFWQKVRGE
jgi:hypothetical protein